jgi:hypothetical protein
VVLHVPPVLPMPAVLLRVPVAVMATWVVIMILMPRIEPTNDVSGEYEHFGGADATASCTHQRASMLANG